MCVNLYKQIETVEEFPNVTDGIFPRKRKDVEPLPSDVISRPIQAEEAAYVHKVPINHDVRAEVSEDIEMKPIVLEKFPIIEEPTVIPTEKITDDIEKKIDLIKKEKLIEEPTIVPEKITTPEEIVDRNGKKIEFYRTTEKKLDEEPMIDQKEIIIPTEKIADRDEKIDFVEEKKSVVEEIPPELIQKVSIVIEEPEIIEDEPERPPTTKIELEPSRELEDCN